jgi:hypothetical protein
MKTNRKQAVRHQRGIYFHSPTEDYSKHQASSPLEDFQTHMFLEDVRLRVMPIGGRARTRLFKVDLNPPNQDVSRMISSALSRESFSYSLESALSDFFGHLAAEVCGVDRAIYEIVYLEDADSKQPTGFELFFIPQHQIVERRRELYQVVPPEVAKERKVEEMILLQRENVVSFELASDLREELRDMRENLSRLSGLEFATLVMEGQKGNVPFDFKAHQRTMDLALAEACRSVGWTGRGALYGKVLSYYWIQKNLVFGKFLIDVRESLLGTLNEALGRIGRRIGVEAQLTISGLPTAKEINLAMEQLRNGSTAFTEIMDPFRY